LTATDTMMQLTGQNRGACQAAIKWRMAVVYTAIL